MSWLARFPPPVHPAPAAAPATVTAIPGEGRAERLPKRGFGGGVRTRRLGLGPQRVTHLLGVSAQWEGGREAGSEGRAAPPASPPQHPPAFVRPRHLVSGPPSPGERLRPPAPLHPRLYRASPGPSLCSPSARLTSIRSPMHAAMFPGRGRPGLGRLAVPPRQLSEQPAGLGAHQAALSMPPPLATPPTPPKGTPGTSGGLGGASMLPF